MPTYTYRFEDGVEVEVTHSIKDDAFEELQHPTKFAVLPVKRVPQRAGALFTGTGWARGTGSKD